MPLEIWESITKFGVQNLSNELNISRHAIYRWNERGRIPAHRYRDLLTLLDVDQDALSTAIWPH